MKKATVTFASGMKFEVTHLDPDEGARHQFYLLNRERLAQLAHRALARGLAPQDFAIVCIDVDDKAWRPLVEVLMPGNEPEWARRRTCGETPIARGSVVRAGLEDFLETMYPGVSGDIFKHPVSKEAILCLVMAMGGLMVYTIAPSPEAS